MNWKATRVVAFSAMIAFGMGLVPGGFADDLIVEEAEAAGVHELTIEDTTTSHECEFPEIKTNCCWHEMPEPLALCWK